MKELYEKIKKAIDNADAVLIGASNGLSISEGYNIFADNAWFQDNFGDFRNKYGIHSILEGSFYNFPGPEEKWAFSSRLISRKSYLEEPSQMMKNLYALVSQYRRQQFFLPDRTFPKENAGLSGFHPKIPREKPGHPGIGGRMEKPYDQRTSDAAYRVGTARSLHYI